jgi:hypothetical protein
VLIVGALTAVSEPTINKIALTSMVAHLFWAHGMYILESVYLIFVVISGCVGLCELLLIQIWRQTGHSMLVAEDPDHTNNSIDGCHANLRHGEAQTQSWFVRDIVQ